MSNARSGIFVLELWVVEVQGYNDTGIYERLVIEMAMVQRLEQRFSHKGKREIEEMLVGQLPDLRETQSGKDLIAIGKVEGKAEGLVMMLEIRFGQIPDYLRESIRKIESEKLIDSHYERALKVSTLSGFTL